MTSTSIQQRIARNIAKNVISEVLDSINSIPYINQIDDEYVTCDNCGNCWDGFAQCSCLGIIISDDEDTIELTKLEKEAK